jgi:hypothetical protein
MFVKRPSAILNYWNRVSLNNFFQTQLNPSLHPNNSNHPSNKPMKKIILNPRWLPLWAALALVASTSQTQAQFPQGSYTNNFATGGNTTPFTGSGSVASWIYWYSAPGGNTPMTNDVTTPDPLGGPDAGSLQVFTPFGTGGNQNLFFGTFDNQYGYDLTEPVNLLNFDTVGFDVYVNTTNQVTGPNTDGNWGQIQVGAYSGVSGFEGFGAGTVTIPGVASNGWVHLSVPIDHTLPDIASIPGICFNYNSYSTGFPKTNFVFWLGNLTMHYTGLPPPPPTVALTKVTPGLAQYANAKPNYNRQDIYTYTNGSSSLTWFGQAKPVKYSWTIASFPPAAYSNFFAGLTLTPDAASTVTYADPDWSAANAVWVGIQNNADGTVTAGIAWKTNQVNGNSQFFTAPGQLVPYNVEANGLTVPAAVGTWTLTFTSDTDMTLTAPNGAVTNASLPAAVAALYTGYVGADLYSAPTVDANVGQHCTYSAYSITGVGTPVNENFAASGVLSSPFLSLVSQGYALSNQNPPNQVFVTTADAYMFSWTLPAPGYSPVVSPTLTSPVWNDIGGSFFPNGATDLLLVPKSSLPSSSQGFFAMIQRQFSQLQILLPGQTNAPGTALGYIGTPSPQSISKVTPITINAVDATFHMVNGSSDTIHISTSDTGAFLPNDAPLVNGTLTISGASGFQFGTTGSQTITATDTTSTNIAPVVSAPVTVGP